MNRLVDFLRSHQHIGKGRAIRRDTLARWLSCTIRDVKHMAEEARMRGIFVGYSTDSRAGGLYLAGSPQEERDIMAKLERLALRILRERSALKRAIHSRSEAIQTELFQ